jgi:hypothetical protein
MFKILLKSASAAFHQEGGPDIAGFRPICVVMEKALPSWGSFIRRRHVPAPFHQSRPTSDQ